MYHVWSLCIISVSFSYVLRMHSNMILAFFWHFVWTESVFGWIWINVDVAFKTLITAFCKVCEHAKLPSASLVKSLLSRSSAVSLEKLSSPKGFQVGWTGGLVRVAAEAGAWGTETPPCWAGWYTLCWEDWGELEGVALADLIVPKQWKKCSYISLSRFEGDRTLLLDCVGCIMAVSHCEGLQIYIYRFDFSLWLIKAGFCGGRLQLLSGLADRNSEHSTVCDITLDAPVSRLLGCPRGRWRSLRQASDHRLRRIWKDRRMKQLRTHKIQRNKECDMQMKFNCSEMAWVKNKMKTKGD